MTHLLLLLYHGVPEIQQIESALPNPTWGPYMGYGSATLITGDLRMINKKLSLLAALLVAALVLAACPQPTPIAPIEPETVVDTQTEEEAETQAPVSPVQGGVWVEGSSADATILNPILASDSASFDVLGWFFPSLLGQDPFSGAIVPTEMAESWDVSEDGLVWTFHLQDGVMWTDGEQVTADDFKFTYNAIASDLVETPRKANLDNIESIEVLDSLTIQVTYAEVKCDALNNLGLGWLPSHLYAEDFSDVMDSPLNEEPTVSAGPFVFNEWTRDDNSTVLRNDAYWKGAPNMDGWIYKIVPDPGARLAQLQTGELDLVGVQPEQLTTVELDSNLNLYKFKDDGYSYIGLNQADPQNPQAGQDEDGNHVEQDPHPILSDLAVRQAIAHALDYDSIISTVYLGQGYQVASNVLPAVGWAHDPSLQPMPSTPNWRHRFLTRPAGPTAMTTACASATAALQPKKAPPSRSDCKPMPATRPVKTWGRWSRISSTASVSTLSSKPSSSVHWWVNCWARPSIWSSLAGPASAPTPTMIPSGTRSSTHPAAASTLSAIRMPASMNYWSRG